MILEEPVVSQLKGCHPERFLFDWMREAKTDSVAEQLMKVDMLSYLPEDLLVKVDIASMMHALEVRSPFLDHPLMEFLASCPIQYKLRQGQSKFLLRRAMRNILPPATFKRPKMGFGIPHGKWLADEWRPWMESILLDPRVDRQKILRRSRMEKMIREHADGTVDHRYKLWNLIVFQLWHDQLLESSG